jgi:hypothetical protein
VTLCLVAHAWLAFADGDPDRAARLEGAAEGLRRRVGLSAWPDLRPLEADLVAQVRRRLGTDHFERGLLPMPGGVADKVELLRFRAH